MAGLRDLIHRYAYGGPVRRYDGATGSVVNSTPQPAFSSDKTINDAWNKLAGQTGADITAQRQALDKQNTAYNENQSVQNLYNLNQANADTFLKDARAGLTPLATGQNPNTQTYTDDAWKTMTAFEKALMANKTGANALLSEFTGTGANPLLGQYTTLPGGTIIPKAPTTTGAPAGNTSAANISNAGTTSGTGTGTGTTTGTTGTSTSSGGNNVFTLLKGQVLPIGAKFDPTLIPVNGTSYTDESGFLHEQTTSGDYTINPITKVIVSYTPYHAKGGTVGMPQEYSRGNWKLI
jgi:hypothetical protein